ncbi:diacylglycerol/lipid kinase family protein [Micrococcoides hystricis]|uniref:diacylglycerol kinase (ATP) n=1 Tax=Micrococcoides hystricis TaxID=1572761 RepID=A0ABV6PB83_9MICC
MDIAAFVIALAALVVAVATAYMARNNRKHLERYIQRTSPLERKVGKLVSEREGSRVSDGAEVSEAAEDSERIVALILNPVKEGAKKVEQLLRTKAAKHGYDDVLVLETTEDDPGKQMALDALADHAEIVFAAGGDGTVRMVAEELAGTGVPMGVVPLGTGNLLARNLDFNVDDVLGHTEKLFTGWHRKVDTMMLTIKMADGSEQTRRSLVIAGVGADAMMIRDTKDELKAIAGWLAYGEAGLKQLVGKRQRVRIGVDGQPAQVRKIRSVMFANVGQLQAGVHFVPDAIIDDGLLDVVVLSPSGGLGWLSVARQTVTGRSRSNEAIEFLQGKRVKFSVLDGGDIACQLDGDVIGDITEITAQVDPGSLLVVVPH